MTDVLTLLFVCDKREDCSPFLAPLRTASVRLLVGHRMEETKTLLSREAVDAIIIDENYLQDPPSLLAELQRSVLRTPVILLRGQSRSDGTKPQGITAICRADPGDDKLLSAIPVFFGFILGKHVPLFRGHNSAHSA